MTHIMVASDGGEGALGALHLAQELARHEEGVRVSVLGANEPFALYGVGTEFAPPPAVAQIEQQQTTALRSLLEGQLAGLGGEATEWPIHVLSGPIALTIARAAREFGATHVFAGIGRHRPVERWFGGETTLGVIHLAHVPVLAVQPGARELPSRVLVAMDFSHFSQAAAEAALPLVRKGAELHLAHVSWPSMRAAPTESLDEWVKTYEKGAIARLEEAGRRLAARRDVRVHTRLLSGEAPAALLDYAEEIGADLIAAGSHGHGFFARIVMGSVSTRLIRRARSSVLIAPSHLAPAEIEEEAGVERASPADGS